MAEPLKLISWNVNGIRACFKKGFLEFVEAHNPDILCLQEIKVDHDALADLDFPFPYRQFYPAQKKGYSGTAILSRMPPLKAWEGLEDSRFNDEGRVLNCRFDGFTLVNVYTPNSKDGLQRLPYRQEQWDPAFREHLVQLDADQPVLSCGDFNVAHQEIDIARPDTNHRSAGFTDEEREGFGRLLDAGFIDTFRHFYPDRRDAYSWWSFRAGARSRNIGWRIDYFLASKRLAPGLIDAEILPEVMGSDHCPVVLKVAIPDRKA
jgi:exodeoxyribonuclease-3